MIRRGVSPLYCLRTLCEISSVPRAYDVRNSFQTITTNTADWFSVFAYYTSRIIIISCRFFRIPAPIDRETPVHTIPVMALTDQVDRRFSRGQNGFYSNNSPSPAPPGSKKKPRKFQIVFRPVSAVLCVRRTIFTETNHVFLVFLRFCFFFFVKKARIINLPPARQPDEMSTKDRPPSPPPPPFDRCTKTRF